jgi:ABC-type multidrug transport system ATPase subunit
VNVDITGAHRSFRKNKAVDGVDLQLGPGVFGLLGPNGAGKTSLLRMLATVLPPSSGEIRLLERDPRGAAARTGRARPHCCG